MSYLKVIPQAQSDYRKNRQITKSTTVKNYQGTRVLWSSKPFCNSLRLCFNSVICNKSNTLFLLLVLMWSVVLWIFAGVLHSSFRPVQMSHLKSKLRCTELLLVIPSGFLGQRSELNCDFESHVDIYS